METASPSTYSSPNIALCSGIALLTAIAGIWMPAIGTLLGFDGLDMLANPIWGLAYNGASGAINSFLGSVPATLGAILILVVGIVAWPLIIFTAVGYGVFRFQKRQNQRFKMLISVIFAATLLINLPASMFTSNGPPCAFFLFMGLIY